MKFEKIISSIKNNIFPFAMLPFIFMLGFGLWYNQEANSTLLIPGSGGNWDLQEVDFFRNIARLNGPVEYMPNELLTPEEFARRSSQSVLSEIQTNTSGTSRIRLRMPDDGWYTFVRNGLNYGERIYINGEWRRTVGFPGETLETSIPDVARIILHVKPDDGWVEIVQQYSNFVDNRFNQHQDWYIGKLDFIERQVIRSDFLVNIILGSYFTLFVINVLMFFLMRGYRANIYFALSCLVWFLRTGSMETSVFTELFPWLDWMTKYRIENMAVPAAIALTVGIVYEIFPDTLPKSFRHIVRDVSIAFMLLCLLGDTYLVSASMQWYMGAYIAAFFFIIVWMALKLRQIDASQGILLAGLAIFIYASIRDAIYISNNVFMPPFQSTYLSHIAMLLFTFMELWSISIAMRKTLEVYSQKEKSMELEKAALQKTNDLKTDMMRTFSHELRTPLAVMMGFAQISAEKARSEGMDEEIVSNLDTIASEAERLAAMVYQMREAALSRQNVKDRKPISLKKVAVQTAGLYAKVLERKGTPLEVDIPDNLPKVFSSEDEMVQVIFNLLRNADKATEKGTITITSLYADGMVQIKVSDTGCGIPVDIYNHMFEKGVSGLEGGTGLGLPIIKEIIESNGGKIWVDSELNVGTEVTFGLPPYRK